MADNAAVDSDSSEASQSEAPDLPKRGYANKDRRDYINTGESRVNIPPGEVARGNFYTNTGDQKPKEMHVNTQVNLAYIPDDDTRMDGHDEMTRTKLPHPEQLPTRMDNAYEDLPDFTTKGTKKNMSKQQRSRACPPEPQVLPPEVSTDEYYNTIDPSNITIATTTGNQGKPPARKVNYSYQHTISSVDGRFVFPFLESHWNYLVADENLTKKVKMEKIADDVESVTTEVLREVFGALRLVTSIVFITILELIRFIAHDVIRRLFIRILVIIGDFILKPLLSTIFNSFFLPVFAFIWNILEAMVKVITPLFAMVTAAMEPVVKLLGAFRLVEIVQPMRLQHDIQTV